MESRLTANYFIEYGPWLAYEFNHQSKPNSKFTRKNINFIKSNKAFTNRPGFWHNMEARILPLENREIIQLEARDEENEAVLKMNFLSHSDDTDNYTRLLIQTSVQTPKPVISMFFTILELHFGIIVKPLNLSPSMIKSLVIYEYTTADDVVLELEDKNNDLFYSLTLPSSLLIDKFENLKNDAGLIDAAVADVLRKTISERITLPRITGFEVESCRLVKDMSKKLRRGKVAKKDRENNEESVEDKVVVFEMEEDNKPSAERCGRIFDWLTQKI